MEQISGQVIDPQHKQRITNFINLSSAIGGGLFLLLENVQMDLKYDPKRKLFVLICKAIIEAEDLEKPLQLTFTRHYAQNRMDNVSEQLVAEETDVIKAKLVGELSKK